MKINRIDHVGIVVEDLEAVKAFFLDFGLELMGEGEAEGDWVERIVGLDDMKVTAAMLQTPEGEANIELIKFHRPVDQNGIQPQPANSLGIRHIAFAVEDIESIAAKLQAKGTALFGEVVNYQDVYKLCYVRGPEGIILELAEPIK